MMNIEKIKGFGPKTVERLNEKEIYSVQDLIEYYPISYQYYNSNSQKNKIAITGTIISELSQYRPRLRLTVTNFTIYDGEKEYKVVSWNQQYLKFTYKKGDQVEIIGKLDAKNKLTASKILQANPVTIQSGSEVKINPVYSKIPYLNNTKIRTLINKALDDENIDIANRNLYQEIHNPVSVKSLNDTIEKLKEHEFRRYYQQLLFKREHVNKNEKYRLNIDRNLINEYIKNLPFKLTESQTREINNIIKKFESNELVKTLILGDVGSGKTIVSIILSQIIIQNDMQVAIMAPTELLARQFYQNIQTFLPQIRSELLVGATKKSDKRRIKSYLETGVCQIIVATHAIIEEDVYFKKLGLVIIDEQHRFGVNQRNKLVSKGENVNYISLSATPIPRTLAQTLYGVFDVNKLDQKPGDRIPIQTSIYTPKTRSIMMQQIEKELDKGHQAFIVTPLVEENEQLENLVDVQKTYQALQKRYEGKYKVGMLHGAMKSNDKELIMLKLRNKEYDLLVATTVIEVGIDIPDATAIAILNAEHFGLATLHQLRGRVGRNKYQSYAILYTNSKTKKSLERLKLMLHYDDGESLSEADLKTRGQGDFIGIKQSGNPDFKLFDMENDIAIANKVISELN